MQKSKAQKNKVRQQKNRDQKGFELQSLLQAQTQQHQHLDHIVEEQASFDCAQFHMGGKALKPRDGRTAKIFDFFLFAFEGELPVLELRFAEMAHELDGIFIVEADKTHQGNPRKLILKDLLKEEPLKRFATKIHVIEVFLDEGNPSPGNYDFQWQMINMVHEAMNTAKQLPGVNFQEDFFIEGDSDEIVSQEALRAVKHCQIGTPPHVWPIASVQMDQYYINFGWKDPAGWSLPSIIVPMREGHRFFESQSKNHKIPGHRLYHAAEVVAPSSSNTSVSFTQDSQQQRFNENAKLLHASELIKSLPCDEDNVMCGVILAELKQIISQGNKAAVLGSAEKPTGWHVSWTLDAENTAKKLANRAAGKPPWCKNLKGQQLIDMTRQKLAEGPQALIGASVVVNTDVGRLPTAAKQDPERFKNLLGPKLYNALGEKTN
jgi:hypothetical protein